MTLILGSSSKTRKALLKRLKLNFNIMHPDIDETPLLNEKPIPHVQRLATEKCQAVRAKADSEAIIITSDQVMDLDGEILSKPTDKADAVSQIMRCSGKSIHFYTSLLVDSPTLPPALSTVTTIVKYREYDEQSAITYLDLEDTLSAAGSIHCDGLGISLLESMSSSDPTAILGLPLITLCTQLRKLGLLTI